MELQVRDVSKTYPNGVQALKDVTLTIPAGMYGLLGPFGPPTRRSSTAARAPGDAHTERVHTLRRLFEKHGSGTPPLPTSMDLYRELQAVTPDQFESVLHDLFEVNAYWELKAEQATAQQTAAGNWEVTLDVRTRKVVIDEASVETEVPMDDWVQVGVFAPGEKGELYMQKHRIRSGKQTITVAVPRKPTRAGIDADNLLIDLETDDNITSVKVKNRGTSRGCVEESNGDLARADRPECEGPDRAVHRSGSPRAR